MSPHNKPVVALLKSKMNQKGGIEKYTHRLASAFAKTGCQTVLLTSGEPPHQSNDYQILPIGKNYKLSVLHLGQFDKNCLQWIKNNPVDVVFGMDRNSYQTHYRAGNGVHAEYLELRTKTDSLWKRMSFRWNPLHRSILRFEKQTFESPVLQTLFCNSHMVKKEILKHYATPESKIQVVHNGVEWHEMACDFAQWPERRGEILKALGLDSSAYQFLFVGKGYRRKGLDFLLNALEKLPFREFQLSVVGKDREKGKYVHLAKKLGLADQVKFFDERSSLVSFYQAADALVIPSTYDPFANVTVEALAMGLYVVSSKQNGGHEILTQHNGIIIENLYDKDSLTAALMQAIRRPKNITNANIARNSVIDLDFSLQLEKIVSATLGIRS